MELSLEVCIKGLCHLGRVCNDLIATLDDKLRVPVVREGGNIVQSMLSFASLVFVLREKFACSCELLDALDE